MTTVFLHVCLIKKKLLLSAAITFFAVSIYAPLTAKLEKAVHVNPSLFNVKEDFENKIIVYADKVDNLFYRPGTIDKIEVINSSALKNLNNDKLKIDIKNEVDKIFSKMEDRIDDYLNWYYSLN